MQCAKWFYDSNEKENLQDLILIHGAFGCGKTFLIVGLIIFVSELLEECSDKKVKILVSGLTNIAGIKNNN